MSAARFAPLFLSALCLSACAGGPAADAVGRYPAGPAGPGGDGQLASLPASAGRVVAVRTTPRANGVTQEVVLDGPRAMAGENRITVDAVASAGGGGRTATGDVLRVEPASDADVAAEMESRLPGIAMRLSPTVERDALGSFGYALGGAGRMSCIYAWQYAAPAHPLTVLEGVTGTGEYPLSIRVRLCRDATASALVDDVRRMIVIRPGALPDAEAGAAGRAGDALEAAVGPLPPAAAQKPEEPAAATIRPARHGRLHAAAHRRSPRRARARWNRPARRFAAPRHREDATALSDAPRLPLPGEVAGSEPAPRAVAAAPAPRPAPVDADALPLPR